MWRTRKVYVEYEKDSHGVQKGFLVKRRSKLMELRRKEPINFYQEEKIARGISKKVITSQGHLAMDYYSSNKISMGSGCPTINTRGSLSITGSDFPLRLFRNLNLCELGL